ncbi:cation diffusion facilitator family transporter [Futiania mangrovi]|uniref:Cation-efflux pump FieF n=1 Tax=Futiania mangrovi TaxID=2959716 RepID=A0A9J6PLF1_9PROT|nr:cation diffusion facilitator family transporter [Futiania mangrovii]MCP1337463.1 cation diffusion facilitator family transporter [Futiania mangrovii]
MTEIDAADARTGPANRKRRERLMRLATYASVASACFLILIKLGAWIATGSLAMLSSLIDSVLDAAASIVNLVAVRHALEPADHEHRFGHGKAEPLAGLGQAALIFGSALFLVFEAGGRLFAPVPVTQSTLGIVVIVVSIAVTLGLVLFQRHVVRVTKSVAIAADSLHYKGDLLMNAGVILALVLAGVFDMPIADPIIALMIAGYIANSAWSIVRQSLDQLMDKEFPEEDRARIRQIATSHREVEEIHDLRTRSSGTYSFIQFHLELDPHMTLARAHRISDEVEEMLQEAFPDADIFIHQDPAGSESAPDPDAPPRLPV